jgi:AbiJ-like protein
MLTDIFANRYADVAIWFNFGEPERRLLVQGFRILSEQVCPFYEGGRTSEYGKSFWTDLHQRISMELGLSSLSPLAYSYPTTSIGKQHTVTGTWSMVKVCENWMLKSFDGAQTPDSFIKERLSLVEIGFRRRGETLAEANTKLESQIEAIGIRRERKAPSAIQMPGDLGSGLRAQSATLNRQFQDSVDELNARFVQAGCELNYHNGFIQLSTDSLSYEEVEKPFWNLVDDPQWKNVDLDMKEALDQRDSGARDPAFYAARALESAVKIISDQRGLTRGGEKGAHNFIDNLASKKSAFIDPWESDVLKQFFTKVRNPMGHGPGSGTMTALNEFQATWAIEFCMSWIKSLIRRNSGLAKT